MSAKNCSETFGPYGETVGRRLYINAEMESHGFAVEETGGGCQAWTRATTTEEHPKGYVLITCDLSLYGDPYAKVWDFGVYDAEGNGIDARCLSSVTLRQAIDAANCF